MSGGAVLKFPVPEDRPERAREIVFNLRPKPVLTTFDRDEARRLLLTAHRISDFTQRLIEFVDVHRESAAEAGIEVLAVELAAEHRNLMEVVDAIEDAVKEDSGVELTLDGLALLRRCEKLVAEADMNIVRFTGGVRAPRPYPSLGQKSSEGILIVPLIFFGAVSIAIVAIALLAPSDKPAR